VSLTFLTKEGKVQGPMKDIAPRRGETFLLAGPGFKWT
jgi:hypothetical protein